MNDIPKGQGRPKVELLDQRGYENKGGRNRPIPQAAVRPPPPAPINPRPAPVAALAKGEGMASREKK